MMSTFKKLAASVFVLSLTACASQAPLFNGDSAPISSSNSALSSTQDHRVGDSVVRLDLEPKNKQESGFLGRVVKTVAGVAAPALGVYQVATGMVADTLVFAAIQTAAAKLTVEENVSNVVNQVDLQQLDQLVLIKDQATDMVVSQVGDAAIQIQGVDAAQLVSQVNAQFDGAENIQNVICTNADPQQLARLQAVDSTAGQGWIDLGYDIQLEGNNPQPLMVRGSDLGSLCGSQTADQKTPELHNKQEVS